MAHKCRLKPFFQTASFYFHIRCRPHKNSGVATISFVKTKRNRTHGAQIPSETLFSDGIFLFSTFDAGHTKIAA